VRTMVEITVNTVNSTTELTPDVVVAAAIEILDRDGRAALSARSLGEALGRSHTAAYRHVGSIDKRLVLAAAQVQSAARPIRTDGPWDVRLRELAVEGWTTCWRPHPWVAEVLLRAGTTQRARDQASALETIFVDAGFDPTQVATAFYAHWSFVLGLLALVNAGPAGMPGPVDVDEVFAFKLDVWIAGLRAQSPGQAGQR
jgi:AcrR family transcriptional regulator